MSADALGAGTIRRLGELPTEARPTLSVYLDLETWSLSTPAARDAQLRALTEEPDLAAAGTEIALVRGLLRSQPELTRSARGLAIFSCSESGLLEAVPLPSRVEPTVVLDTAVWLEPLADLIAFGNLGVAVIGRLGARLFRGGASALSEFSSLKRSPADGEDGAGSREHLRPSHLNRAAEQLLRAHRRRPFAQLVIVTCDQVWPAVEASLDPELRQLVTGVVRADLGRASTAEILHVVAPLIEGVEMAQERALMTQLEGRVGLGEGAVCGLAETLLALQQERVAILLIAEGARLTAGRCTHCQRVSTSCGRCELDGADRSSVDAIAAATRLAEDQAAVVVSVRHERDALIGRGSIAAMVLDEATLNLRIVRPETLPARRDRQTPSTAPLTALQAPG